MPFFVSRPIRHKFKTSDTLDLLLWILIFVLLPTAFISYCISGASFTRLNRLSFTENMAPRALPEVFVMTTSSVLAMIVQEAYRAGIDPVKALRIAQCESKFNPRTTNKKSSAKGIYQILDKTWTYCKGDRFKVEDSVACFVKLYPKHPNYWVCK